MARTPARHNTCPRCGARLARDNDSGCCTPCHTAERDRLTTPPTLPATFWDHEPIRQALHERHLGKVVRAYRYHLVGEPKFISTSPQPPPRGKKKARSQCCT